MLNQALEDSPGLTISDVELKRSGPSYTIDTVQHFKHTLPDQSRIYLIMGMDAFLEIDTWKSYDELLLQIPFIIINRPKSGSAVGDSGWKFMENFLASKISADYVFSEYQSCYRAQNKQPIYVFEVTSLDISSTRVRNLSNTGRSIEYLVPQKVAEFINSKGLYL
jgi:nicotinate-nucleotide adenylyltransferase